MEVVPADLKGKYLENSKEIAKVKAEEVKPADLKESFWRIHSLSHCKRTVIRISE